MHPSQVGICNDVFSPQPDEIDWARKVVAAFDEADGPARSVLRIDGRMVERLHAAAANGRWCSTPPSRVAPDSGHVALTTFAVSG